MFISFPEIAKVKWTNRINFIPFFKFYFGPDSQEFQLRVFFKNLEFYIITILYLLFDFLSNIRMHMVLNYIYIIFSFVKLRG